MKGITIRLVMDDLVEYAVEPFDGDSDALSAVLGGYLEAAPSVDQVTVWCNEEGKALGLPINGAASIVWATLFDRFGCYDSGDHLAGNVVFTGGVDANGETLDLPADAEQAIRELLS